MHKQHLTDDHVAAAKPHNFAQTTLELDLRIGYTRRLDAFRGDKL
jgi:hypothetical protein